MLYLGIDQHARQITISLSELLWGNRYRFLAGKPIRGLRQVDHASAVDCADRAVQGCEPGEDANRQ